MQGVLAQPGAMPEEEMDSEGISPEDDQVTDELLTEVQRKLYDEGAADAIGQAIVSSDDPMGEIVEQAMTLVGVVDDASGGAIPDDTFIMFAIALMGEVIEIAQAAGVQLSGRDIAEAIKQFIVRGIQEMGGDTSQVEQAMSAINPDELGAAMEQEMQA